MDTIQCSDQPHCLRTHCTVLGLQAGCDDNEALAVRMQTSDLLAGLRLAADAPPAAVTANEEAGGGAGNGASQVPSAQQGLHLQ